MLSNKTVNQHFVTRVEQKLNALNPGADDSNLKIYSFTISDREHYRLALENTKGRSIHRNLSLFDLFSFDVLDNDRLRMNLESLFQRYEAHVERHTRTLLDKLSIGNADVKEEIVELFAAKLLNFIRNPFSIPKVLNTFPGLCTYIPTDPELQASFHRIIEGRKPHQAHLCALLGIDEVRYGEWLRTLFMLLAPMGGPSRPNFFEEAVKGLFESKNTKASAYVWAYDNDRCLLSDRGYCMPIPEGQHLGFSFNLCSHAFIDYTFMDVKALLGDKFAPEVIEPFFSQFTERPVISVDVSYERNNRQMLVRYNRRVVDYSFERVYCTSKDGIVFS